LRYLVVRKSGSREDGNLLTTSDGVHRVDGRNTCLDHLLGVDARVGVDGRPINIQVLLGKHLGALINGVSRTVEDATEHVLRDGELHAGSRELDVSSVDVDSRGALEDLNDGLATGDLEDLSTASSAVREGELDDL
jgi:hypothetical protein